VLSPQVPNLTLTDSSGKIAGCHFQGLQIEVLTLNAGGSGITFNDWVNCALTAVSGNSAINFNYEANGTGTGIQNENFLNCWFSDTNTTSASPPAFWNFNCGTGGTGGNGHTELSLCSYVSKSGSSGTNNTVFMSTTGALVCGPPLVNSSQMDFVTLNTATANYSNGNMGTGVTYFVLVTPPASSGNCEAGFLFTNTYFESGTTTKNIVAFGLNSVGASGTWQGRATFANTHVLGSSGFFILNTGSTAPSVQATKDAGVTFSGYSETGTPKGALGTYLNLAPNITQGSGSTNPTYTQSGIGTAGWYLDILYGGTLGYAQPTPTLPTTTGIYLGNFYGRTMEVLVSAVAGATGVTLKTADSVGASGQSQGAPATGSRYLLRVGDQIAFAWATTAPTVLWRAL